MTSSKNEGEQIPITLKIKRKGFEVVVQGDIPTITKRLDALSDFIELLDEKLHFEAEKVEVEKPPSPQELSSVSTSDVPIIKPSKSTTENIVNIFQTPWGRQPRTLAEVIKALETNAVPDTPEKVSVYLARLVKKGFLRRIEKDGKWAYFHVAES
ncbi:MAG: hypothetical protein RMJ14_03325 [Nitrososphaerota archaeon]|nr:BlaI/MecI/CopY family transcriptional regulator [Aigarchaeota archaeon]MDW8076651.1 hypothetical protein [Nitrososphaerota archaeon]